MKVQIKSLVLGLVLAYLLLAGAFASLLYVGGREDQPVFRDQVLTSGKKVKITSCNLAWGAEHQDRRTSDDSFTLEYVSSAAHEDPATVDQETLEVFELIRPVSEQWGFDRATISAFPRLQRTGKYYLYAFTRAPDGKWTFNRNLAKVHIND